MSQPRNDNNQNVGMPGGGFTPHHRMWLHRPMPVPLQTGENEQWMEGLEGADPQFLKIFKEGKNLLPRDVIGARELFSQALSRARELGSSDLEAYSYSQLGNCSIASGSVQDALRCYSEAKELSKGRNELLYLFTLGDLAKVHGIFENWRLVIDNLTEQSEITRNGLGGPGLRFAVLDRLATAHAKAKNFDESIKALTEMRTFAAQKGEHALEGHCFEKIAVLQSQNGNIAGGIDNFEKAALCSLRVSNLSKHASLLLCCLELHVDAVSPKDYHKRLKQILSLPEPCRSSPPFLEILRSCEVELSRRLAAALSSFLVSFEVTT
eukprot:TRINITY_DN1835_c2_g1_i1.p1 TRINITY_DN1835_c2_g1~~TRINITY_DN1835_c2_g1_i1.p1  ORF type:complete len:323 (+),score=50.50 TRINITY_DN1835_c2_g1_i1:29-997(+)